MSDDVLSGNVHDLGEATTATLCRPILYEELAQGERELRRLFREVPARVVSTGSVLIATERPSRALYALHRGWACRMHDWPNGRRAIPQIHVPGEFIGIETALRARAVDEVVTLQPVTVRALDIDALPGLLEQRSTAVYLAWLMSEAQRRAERRADGMARLEAVERLAAMLVDLHERLHRRELVTAGSFNLPLTQQQIGDHLGLTVVHVNRMVRQLREEKIAIIDKQVVIIRDMARLRRLANGEFDRESAGRRSSEIVGACMADPLPPGYSRRD